MVRTALPSTEGPFTLRARNVTGTQDLPLEIDRGLTVGEVSRSISALMDLPADVPWVLRDDGTSAFLDEGRSIGDQLEPGACVTMTPRTHLG